MLQGGEKCLPCVLQVRATKMVSPSIWADLVADFLSEKNPYCAINFQRYKLYAPSNNLVAKLWFHCGIEGCSLNGAAVLDHQMFLHVTNESTEMEHIKGKPKSFRSRFVSWRRKTKIRKIRFRNDLS